MIIRMTILGAAALALSWCGMPPQAAASESSAIKVILQNTGADPDAVGMAVAALNPKKSALNVKAAKLDPGATYKLVLGGQQEAEAIADSMGRVFFALANTVRGSATPLAVDPRGSLLSIRLGDTAVLEAVLSGSGEPAGSYVLEQTHLEKPDALAAKTASAQYALSKEKRTFKIVAPNASRGTVEVYVGGIRQGDTEVRNRTAVVRFSSSPRGTEDLLDFDPRNQVVDLVQGTNVLHSGVLAADARDLNHSNPTIRFGQIPSTGVDNDASAKAKLRTLHDATRTFSVEIEDVDEGVYELLADGVLQGLINVVPEEDGAEGEIEFSSRSDDEDELPLIFDPLAATFVIQREGTVYFEGPFSELSVGAGDDPVLIEEFLTSTGLDPGASGDAKFEIDDNGRHKFSVEIEDVPAGRYEVWAGGVRRGVFNTVTRQDGQVEGEIEFTSRLEPGKWPLRFEPRGEVIEVRSNAGVLFSHLFGAGGGGGPASAPLEINLPLFSTEAGSGEAKAEYERNDRGDRSFDIELEDVPEGVYSVLVGGVEQGTITVVRIGDHTRGKIEFEDTPELGELPLTFDALGQVIQVARDATIWFDRTFPTGQ